MHRNEVRSLQVLHMIMAVLLVIFSGAATSHAQVIDGGRWSVPKIPSQPAKLAKGGNPFEGDTYSIAHQLGALIDGVFQCFSAQGSNTASNTVLFDGLTELLDPYVDGTQPAVLEFEQSQSNTVTINSFLEMGTDLFPEGFKDPDTNMPLTDACIEIGIDDTLDSNVPTTITSATLQLFGGGGTPPLDITSSFDDPWDGRLSLVFPNRAGTDITGVVLELTTEPNTTIFADGFESGDASSWTK